MIIIITASLTEEQALILAKEKWYSETITNINFETEINPQTPWEFLKSVYENMIIEDSTKEFMKYKERTYIEEQRKQMEIETRNEVVAGISSIVE